MLIATGHVLAHGSIDGSITPPGFIEIDPVTLGLGLGAGAAYALGVTALTRRGRRWPAGRSLSFGLAVGVFLFATQAGPAPWDTVSFSAHVVQHLLLGMVVGALVALAAPLTLLLQAGNRSTQVAVLRFTHSGPIRVLTHPVTAWCLFTLTLYALYFTSLYELSLRNDVVHGAIHLHFVLAGFVFFAIVLGTDPLPRRIPHGARLLLVLSTVPFHAFLGIALMTGTVAVAGDWYASVERFGSAPVIEDQHLGGAIMWGVGEALTIAAAVIITRQWMHHDQREAIRLDRRLTTAEDDLTAAVGS